MPKSFMVKNSKRWNPPRSSRDIEIPAAVNLGKCSILFSSEYIYIFLNTKKGKTIVANAMLFATQLYLNG